MPTSTSSSPSSSSPVIIPLTSSARQDDSSFSLSRSNSASNVSLNKNSTKQQRRQHRLGSAWVRVISLGSVLAILVSWEVYNGVRMTSFKAEIGIIEESLLLLNISIMETISEKLFSFQQQQPMMSQSQPREEPKVDITTAHRVVKQRSPIMDLLCSECRATMTSLRQGTMSCGNLIKNQMQKLNQTHSNNSSLSSSEGAPLLFNAAVDRVVLEIAPTECARCRPDACNATLSSEREYWRPDDAAPRVIMAKTLQLSTIPEKHRVPPSMLSDLASFFSNKSNVYPARTYFFEYNPTIVQIPKSQIPLNVLTPDEADQAKYLASFRVTNMQQCISGNDEIAMIGGQWPRPPSQDYLGLALLRSDLSVIANVVLNNSKNSLKTIHSLSSMEDYRLFVLQDQIYVASFHEIVPLWLVPPTPALDDRTIRVVPNLFPSNLTVMARSFSSCPNVRMGSKNINYVWDPERNETIVEDEPMGRKVTINLTKRCSVNAYRPNKDHQNTDAGRTLKVAGKSSVPFRSFGSVDELHLAKHGVFRNLMTGERGSACCVRITDPRGNVNDTSHDADHGSRKQQKELWLGISHSKFKFRNRESRHNLPGNVSANHFFSTFYAFDTHEPFAVQAISGRFCLGFPTLEETTTPMSSTTGASSLSHMDKNPYGRQNKNALRLGADYFDCPAIHFVSGMVEKADDPSRIIIAYGVNDCAPRFVEVGKKEIQQMLFSKRQS